MLKRLEEVDVRELSVSPSMPGQLCDPHIEVPVAVKRKWKERRSQVDTSYKPIEAQI